MELKDVASIAGKKGLFVVVKPTRNGVIVETLDEKKKKIAFGVSARASILQEVSIYTTDADGSVPLGDVFKAIYEKYGKDLALDSKSSEEDLRNLLEEVLPNYDREKVYFSDLKKLVLWYHILIEFAKDVLESLLKEEESTTATEAEGVTKEEEKQEN